MERLSHTNKKGYSRMMDISEKNENIREAIARGSIYMKKETLRAIKEGKITIEIPADEK